MWTEGQNVCLLSNDVFDLVVDQSHVVVDLSLKTHTDSQNKSQPISRRTPAQQHFDQTYTSTGKHVTPSCDHLLSST